MLAHEGRFRQRDGLSLQDCITKFVSGTRNELVFQRVFAMGTQEAPTCCMFTCEAKCMTVF